ncbi:NAD(P)-binding domain-containing protein [Streptomyces mirabilis]|uniref:NAD(P)-binding domain-containing protein n=1 Tax=Streptomyces mirabilis TaxID=68239 RepID=UPI00364E44C8
MTAGEASVTVGFVGLGDMGGALAANVLGAGLDLVAHDAAGPLRRRSLIPVLVNPATDSGRICRAAVGRGVRATRTRR